MKQRIRIHPYKQGSRSAMALADALGGKVLKLEGSKYVQRPSDCVINWGSSRSPYTDGLNKPEAITRASNKLTAFQVMKEAGVSVPDFWTRVEDIPNERVYPVVCRTVLSGHSGAGIHIADNRAGIVNAPLYVKYIKKLEEYRVHVFKQSIITIQRKARRHDVEEPNWRVRNHANGFVFVRNDVNPHPSVTDQALAAVEALGLDFGAVDIIWNDREGKSYVLEVNCAPGLEGQTIEDYARAFTKTG